LQLGWCLLDVVATFWKNTSDYNILYMWLQHLMCSNCKKKDSCKTRM
jgi:hypothetical protein